MEARTLGFFFLVLESVIKDVDCKAKYFPYPNVISLFFLLAFNVFRALTLMKTKLKGAVKGHSLLKKKSDALTLRFRAILRKIAEVNTIVVGCKLCSAKKRWD